MATADGYLLAWEEQPAGGVAQPNRPMWRRLDADGAPLAGADALAGALGENLGVGLGELDGEPFAAWSDPKSAVVTTLAGAVGPGREAALSSGRSGPGLAGQWANLRSPAREVTAQRLREDRALHHGRAWPTS